MHNVVESGVVAVHFGSYPVDRYAMMHMLVDYVHSQSVRDELLALPAAIFVKLSGRPIISGLGNTRRQRQQVLQLGRKLRQCNDLNIVTVVHVRTMLRVSSLVCHCVHGFKLVHFSQRLRFIDFKFYFISCWAVRPHKALFNVKKDNCCLGAKR